MSPKTLTGAELQLDDGPERESGLSLVDGNNLATYYALPEELATSEGFSTNARLGFTNMLFKLLFDYGRRESRSPGTRASCLLVRDQGGRIIRKA